MLELDCDVLVIGGGLAGCWAALKAKEYASKVTLVEKGKVSRSGKSSFSGAGLLCPYTTDDLDSWQREIVERGEYLGDQDWIEILLQEQPKRIGEMEKWGLNFERDEKGNLLRVSALGSIITKSATVSSQNMMEILKGRMLGSSVNILERVMITGLLTSDGIYPTKGFVIGAYGFNTRTGEPVHINAGATIICSGGTEHTDLTGDGVAQAYRAGAEVWGMEFSRTMDNMGFADKYTGIHLITFQRLGMKLLNSKGERFMLRYNPEQKESVTRHELALSIISEGLEGRSPIYADLTHLDKNSMDMLRNLATTSRRVKALESEGIDFSKEKIKFNVHSGFISSESGGIRHNIFGETSLPGLYVAGEAGGYPANGAGSIPLKLASCCVGGYRAGENASKYALETGKKKVKKEQIKDLEKETFSPIKMNKGIKPQGLVDTVNEYLSPAMNTIFRSGKSLRTLLKEQQGWVEDSKMLKAEDWHELVKANKTKNYIDYIGLVFRSSLEREETRGVNIRIDYPYRDDINWLKYVIIKRGEKDMQAGTFPVPIYRFKVKPEKYEKVPVKIAYLNKALQVS